MSGDTLGDADGRLPITPHPHPSSRSSPPLTLPGRIECSAWPTDRVFASLDARVSLPAAGLAGGREGANHRPGAGCVLGPQRTDDGVASCGAGPMSHQDGEESDFADYDPVAAATPTSRVPLSEDTIAALHDLAVAAAASIGTLHFSEGAVNGATGTVPSAVATLEGNVVDKGGAAAVAAHGGTAGAHGSVAGAHGSTAAAAGVRATGTVPPAVANV